MWNTIQPSKRKDIWLLAATEINLEDVTLSGKGDTEKLAKSHLCMESKKFRLTEAECRTVVTRDKEVGKWGDVVKGYEVAVQSRDALMWFGKETSWGN